MQASDYDNIAHYASQCCNGGNSVCILHSVPSGAGSGDKAAVGGAAAAAVSADDDKAEGPDIAMFGAIGGGVVLLLGIARAVMYMKSMRAKDAHGGYEEGDLQMNLPAESQAASPVPNKLKGIISSRKDSESTLQSSTL